MLLFLAIAYAYPNTTAYLVAQANGTASELAPWAVLFNTGVCGIWLWTMLTGKTHTHSEYERIVNKLDAAEKELLRRSQEERETLIPALVRSTDILARYLDRRDNDTPPPPSRQRRPHPPPRGEAC